MRLQTEVWLWFLFSFWFVFEYKKIDESNIISDMKRVLSLEIKKPIKTIMEKEKIIKYKLKKT